MTKEEYFGDWSKVVDLDEADRIMKKLVASNTTICPQIKDVFKAFTLCPLNSLRVVALGQDPYPDIYKGKPRATGLAFANPTDTPDKDISPSLEVLKESIIDYTFPHKNIIFEPDLEKWEKQGVLLLNTALTCEAGRVGSHALLWRPFIRSLLTKLSCYHIGVVYILMGTAAQSFEPYINKQFNYIIRERHPSWYAREKKKMPSEIWRNVNEVLTSLNGYGIEWYNEY